MTFNRKFTHVDEGLGNLIAQFEDKERFKKYLTAFLNQVQELEIAYADVADLTDDIDAAFGQQLDNLGEIVGEERFGRDDAVYRTALKARILLNKSAGTIEDLIAILATLQPGLVFTLSEGFPASFLMTISTPIDPAVTDIDQLGFIIKSGRAAGVRGILVFGVLGGKQFDTAGAGFDEGEFGGSIEVS